MHPYKLVPANELADDDFDRQFVYQNRRRRRRILFCKQMIQMIDDNTLQIENLHFTAMLIEKLSLLVERNSSPDQGTTLHTQHPEKVWAGIIGEHIIGPFFVNGNLNGIYFALLQNNVVPTMANLYPAEGNPQLPGNTIWLKQDGAPAHYEVNVRQYLHTIFPNRWIRRRGSVEWPSVEWPYC
ncbi:hypothetical protein NQ318_013046 [Aromia moschata]|uniref:Transposase n=1 Tax=Aromia moschata TaxID=1265417 RepID=A0AAV8XLD8_9CUCU|nr:hypothetical protein NQ318_013046 [Aromia moschata]